MCVRTKPPLTYGKTGLPLEQVFIELPLFKRPLKHLKWQTHTDTKTKIKSYIFTQRHQAVISHPQDLWQNHLCSGGRNIVKLYILNNTVSTILQYANYPWRGFWFLHLPLHNSASLLFVRKSVRTKQTVPILFSPASKRT